LVPLAIAARPARAVTDFEAARNGLRALLPARPLTGRADLIRTFLITFLFDFFVFLAMKIVETLWIANGRTLHGRRVTLFMTRFTNPLFHTHMKSA